MAFPKIPENGKSENILKEILFTEPNIAYSNDTWAHHLNVPQVNDMWGPFPFFPFFSFFSFLSLSFLFLPGTFLLPPAGCHGSHRELRGWAAEGTGGGGRKG